MQERDDILAEIEAYLALQAMEPTAFGRAAMHDPNFVRDLRRGRRLWPETVERVRTFLANSTKPSRSRT